MASLEDGADLHGKWLAAVVAFVHAYAATLALHLAILLYTAAVRADWATRPDTRLHEVVGCLLVVEVRGREDGFVHGCPKSDWSICLLRFACNNIVIDACLNI